MNLNKMDRLLEQMKQSLLGEANGYTNVTMSTTAGSKGKAQVGSGVTQGKEIGRQDVHMDASQTAKKGKSAVGTGRMKDIAIKGQQVTVDKNDAAKKGKAGLK